jgi:hypothetical protein
MGAMMWVMMRSQRRGGDEGEGQEQAGQEQVAQLRAEIDQLKADRAGQRAQGGQ